MSERTISIRFPEYNPFCFELARHARGYSKKELAEKSGISIKILSQIENGDILPSEQNVSDLSLVLKYPDSFFRQIFESKISCEAYYGSVPINYMEYKVVRDLNNLK